MKKKFMKAGACVLSAAMIMGLYAGPAFADWVENQNGARMWVQDGTKLMESGITLILILSQRLVGRLLVVCVTTLTQKAMQWLLDIM